MGFSIEVPLPGAPFSSEGVKVGNALATISSWANGGIVGSDLAPGANIQASQLAAGITLPTGAVLPFAGPAVSAPNGFLICDGSAVLRASYPALFSLLGAAYGAGDGSSTFNLPDLRGRVIVGAGNGTGLTPRGIGLKGGEETHQLSVAELPSHVHPLTDTVQSTNLYTLTGTNPAAGSGRYQVAPWSTGFTELIGGSTGGGASHNTMQPFQVINYLIKT
jgi:microcystin-dependent protein